MSLHYHGGMKLSDVLPSIKKLMKDIKDALEAIKTTIEEQLKLLLTAKSAIELAVLSDVKAALDASLDAGLNLSITDPTALLASLTLGMGQALANIKLINPLDLVSVQVADNLKVSAELKARHEALQLVLKPLQAILDKLNGTVKVVAKVLVPSVELLDDLEGSIVYAYTYTGTIAAFETEVAGRIAADTGLAPGAQITMRIIGAEPLTTGSTAIDKLFI